jgi:DNA polymerase-3 subunit beta
MQFTATQQELHHGLALVGHAISGKPTRPIETYILAQVAPDTQQVCLSARNEELGIHCWIRASEMEGHDAVLLPARLISDFVSNLPAAPVVVTSPSPTDPTSCQVRCLRISAKMKNTAGDLAEFPQIPSYVDGGETLLHLDAELLKQIITEVVFAAADKDMTRPALTGVLVEIGGGKATFAAADNFRLAVRTILIPDDQLRRTLLLPARTLEELAKILPNVGTVQVLLTADQHQAVFHSSMIDVSTRLLNETFPNMRAGIIPSEWTTRAVLQTQDLAALIRLMAPFAREARYAIRLRLVGEMSERLDAEPNTMQLEVVAQDVGENQNVLGAQITGPDQELLLHAKHLSDVLAVLTTPQMALEITGPQRPVAIKPVGGDDYTYVLAPMIDHQARSRTRPAEPAPTTATR